jgi:hypothetical protein
VVFNSNAGNLLAGIEIGKTIRLKSFATAVLDGLRCASSCAFAWLGGSPRFMEQGARIGFHAAYIDSAGGPWIERKRQAAFKIMHFVRLRLQRAGPCSSMLAASSLTAGTGGGERRGARPERSP